jgi:glycosyltransferase involved in cell wall biosynthesis
MNVLLLTSHAIAEYDDLRMLTDLGYDVFSIGGAYDDVPFEGKRPPLDVPAYPELVEACHDQRAHMAASWGDPRHNIDWAKAQLAPDVLDWADTIIVHHFPESWIAGQWDRIKSKRVIWRTCGQSGPDGSTERVLAPLRAAGLQIVRYSPKEVVLPDYAGHDEVIRFGKYPSDYGPWIGDDQVVGNVTQNMAQRGDACGLGTWLDLTLAVPTKPAGPGSEVLPNGVGALDYPAMLRYLQRLRAYLYTGTHPASYTLGLMEAMLSGVPVVAPAWDTGHLTLDSLYEAPRILPRRPSRDAVPGFLRACVEDYQFAREVGQECRSAALSLFDVAIVGPQWKAFLG